MGDGNIAVEWKGDPVYDVVADSVLTVLLCLEYSKSSVQATKQHHSHHHDMDEIDGKQDSIPKQATAKEMTDEERVSILTMYLAEFYEDVEYETSSQSFSFKVPIESSSHRVSFSPLDWKLKCDNKDVHSRVSSVLSYCQSLYDADLIYGK